jgi:hypothetical protein
MYLALWRSRLRRVEAILDGLAEACEGVEGGPALFGGEGGWVKMIYGS